MKKNLIAILLVGLLAIFAGVYIYSAFNGKRDVKRSSGSSDPEKVEVSEPKFRHDGQLSIMDASGSTSLGDFDIEIVESEYEITTGLMYRKQMDSNRGMLFIFPDVRMRSFWMKNTHISLDIVFIGEDGRIVNVANDTKPFSTTSIPSTGPAKYVLELNAGTAKRQGWGPGNLVVWNRK